MPVSRRELLAAVTIVPVGFAVGNLVSTAGRSIDAAIARIRPGAAGTSATRCAACGGPDHTMLDPACPMNRPVLRREA